MFKELFLEGRTVDLRDPDDYISYADYGKAVQDADKRRIQTAKDFLKSVGIRPKKIQIKTYRVTNQDNVEAELMSAGGVTLIFRGKLSSSKPALVLKTRRDTVECSFPKDWVDELTKSDFKKTLKCVIENYRRYAPSGPDIEPLEKKLKKYL